MGPASSAAEAHEDEHTLLRGEWASDNCAIEIVR